MIMAPPVSTARQKDEQVCFDVNDALPEHISIRESRSCSTISETRFTLARRGRRALFIEHISYARHRSEAKYRSQKYVH